MRACLISLLTLFLSTSLQAADNRADAVQDWVEANVPEMMREAHMPGFSIAVIEDGRMVYADGFGARDPAKNLPATADTLFGIGSITKSFVAIAILQLAEEGKLSLDDPVSKYLPFEISRPGEPILIRHLLTHTSGVPNLGTSTVLISRGLGEDTGVPMSSAADFFRFVNAAGAEVQYPPGEKYFYNNAGYRMLGAIIQKQSGLPFHEYVTQKVMRPLGMTRSTFDTDKLFADPDHLVPHQRTADGAKPMPFPYPNPVNNTDFSFLSAAGGITSSVTEMMPYLNMLIDKGRYPGGRLVSERSMADMQKSHFGFPAEYFGPSAYGYGLTVTQDFLGTELVGHSGSISVSTAWFAVIPEKRIGVVMMGNSGGMGYTTIGHSVLAIMLGKDPQVALPVVGLRDRMNRLEGTYSTYRNLSTVHVVNDGGLLFLKWSEDGDGVPLIPEDMSYRQLNFHTLSESEKTPVDFSIDDTGQVSFIIGRSIYHKTP